MPRAVSGAASAHLRAIVSRKPQLTIARKCGGARLGSDGSLTDPMASAIVETRAAHHTAIIAGETSIATARAETARAVTRTIRWAIGESGDDPTIIARVAVLAEARAVGKTLTVCSAIAGAACTREVGEGWACGCLMMWGHARRGGVAVLGTGANAAGRRRACFYLCMPCKLARWPHLPRRLSNRHQQSQNHMCIPSWSSDHDPEETHTHASQNASNHHTPPSNTHARTHAHTKTHTRARASTPSLPPSPTPPPPQPPPPQPPTLLPAVAGDHHVSHRRNAPSTGAGCSDRAVLGAVGCGHGTIVSVEASLTRASRRALPVESADTMTRAIACAATRQHSVVRYVYQARKPRIGPQPGSARRVSCLHITGRRLNRSHRQTLHCTGTRHCCTRRCRCNCRGTRRGGGSNPRRQNQTDKRMHWKCTVRETSNCAGNWERPAARATTVKIQNRKHHNSRSDKSSPESGCGVV